MNDTYLIHEALDRAHLMAELVETAFEHHPVINQNHELKSKCDEAVSALNDLYQMVGNIGE